MKVVCLTPVVIHSAGDLDGPGVGGVLNSGCYPSPGDLNGPGVGGVLNSGCYLLSR